MAQIFIFTVAILLILLGISELLHAICSAVIKPKQPSKKVLVTVLTDEDAIEQVFAVCEEYKWQGDRYADKIIAVSSDLSPETLDICVRDYGDMVKFTTFENLQRDIEYYGRS